MKIFADYHTHTCYSHGKGTIRENIEAAIKAGLKEIAISEHGPALHSIKRLGVKDAATLLEIKEKIDKYNKLYPEIKVLSAVEANIVSMDGKLDVPLFILKELDKVLVGLHLFIIPASLRDGIEIIFNNLVCERLNIRREEIRYKNTELLIKVLENYPVDIITHPGFQVNIDTKTLAQVAAKKDVALEINARHGHLAREFVEIASKEGARFSLGSDAHKPEEVGRVEKALKVVEDVGLTAEDVINGY